VKTGAHGGVVEQTKIVYAQRKPRTCGKWESSETRNPTGVEVKGTQRPDLKGKKNMINGRETKAKTQAQVRFLKRG